MVSRTLKILWSIVLVVFAYNAGQSFVQLPAIARDARDASNACRCRASPPNRIINWGSGPSSGTRSLGCIHARHFRFRAADAQSHKDLVDEIKTFQYEQEPDMEDIMVIQARLAAALRPGRKARKEAESYGLVQEGLFQCRRASAVKFRVDPRVAVPDVLRDFGDVPRTIQPDIVLRTSDKNQTAVAVIEVKRDLEMNKWTDDKIVDELNNFSRDSTNKTLPEIQVGQHLKAAYEAASNTANLGIKWACVTTVNSMYILHVTPASDPGHSIDVVIHPRIEMNTMDVFMKACLVIPARNMREEGALYEPMFRVQDTSRIFVTEDGTEFILQTPTALQASLGRDGLEGRCVLAGFNENLDKFFIKTAEKEFNRRMLRAEYGQMEAVRALCPHLVPTARYCQMPDIGLECIVSSDAGPSLDQLPEEDALFHLDEAAKLLTAHGLSHPDLHPRNICLDPSGQLRLIDFEPSEAFSSDEGQNS